MVLNVFKSMNEGIRILVQQPDMEEIQREKFIENFKEEPCDTLVGFAVMGGFFAEGIDLVGDGLCAAAIVGVGLPMICSERELIRRYYQEKMGAGFDFAYERSQRTPNLRMAAVFPTAPLWFPKIFMAGAWKESATGGNLKFQLFNIGCRTRERKSALVSRLDYIEKTAYSL